MKWLGIVFFITPYNFGAAKAFANNTVVHFANVTTMKPRQKDSVTWIEDFKLFRTAVYTNDITAIKKYFIFPVLNTGNDIWIMLEMEKAFKKAQAAGDKIIPFKEADLEKYYKKIFTGPFVKSLMKVKTDVLSKKHDTETPEQKEGKATTYKMYVTYNTETKILSLNLACNTVYKNKAGEIEDGGESNVIYNFTVEKNGIYFLRK